MDNFRCLTSFEYCLCRNSALRLLKLKVNTVKRRQYPFRTSKDSDLQERKLWQCKIPAESNAAVKEPLWSSCNPMWSLCIGRRQKWNKEWCLEKTVVSKLQYKSFSHYLPLGTVSLQSSEIKLVLSTLACAALAPCRKIAKLVKHFLPLSLIQAVLSPSDG